MRNTWARGLDTHAALSIKQINSVALACERSIPTERPPLVGEVSANVLRIEERNGSLWPYSRFSRPEPLLILPSSFSVVLTRLSGPVLEPLLLRKSGRA
jgi:hypothetical protein